MNLEEVKQDSSSNYFSAEEDMLIQNDENSFFNLDDSKYDDAYFELDKYLDDSENSVNYQIFYSDEDINSFLMNNDIETSPFSESPKSPSSLMPEQKTNNILYNFNSKNLKKIGKESDLQIEQQMHNHSNNSRKVKKKKEIPKNDEIEIEMIKNEDKNTHANKFEIIIKNSKISNNSKPLKHVDSKDINELIKNSLLSSLKKKSNNDINSNEKTTLYITPFNDHQPKYENKKCSNLQKTNPQFQQDHSHLSMIPINEDKQNSKKKNYSNQSKIIPASTTIIKSQDYDHAESSFKNDLSQSQSLPQYQHPTNIQSSYIQNDKTTQQFQMIDQKVHKNEDISINIDFQTKNHIATNKTHQNYMQSPTQKFNDQNQAQAISHSLQSQISIINNFHQKIEDQILSKTIFEPSFFQEAMIMDELILNPYELMLEPRSFWVENCEDYTFGTLVNNFFRINRSRVSKFIYKLYNMLLITSKNPFYKGIIGVNWVTYKIFSIDVQCIAAMLNISNVYIDSYLFGPNGNFAILNFAEITPNNYQEAGLSSFPEIIYPNIKLFYHRDQKFLKKELSTLELDEIERQSKIMRCSQKKNNKIIRFKYPAFSF